MSSADVQAVRRAMVSIHVWLLTLYPEAQDERTVRLKRSRNIRQRIGRLPQQTGKAEGATAGKAPERMAGARQDGRGASSQTCPCSQVP